MTIETGYTVPAGESVLDHLGLDPAYAAKAKLAVIFTRAIKDLNLSQREVYARTGLPQARVSEVCRGKLQDVSRERLEDALQKLGYDILIAVAADRHDGAGELRVEQSTRILEFA